MKELKTSGSLIIGALGAGQIVREQHFPVLAALPGVSLAWVADLDKESAANLARIYDCAAIEPEKLTDDRLTEIDVLLIAVPYGVRNPYYNRLGSGFSELSLFIEKPLARTVAEHARIAKLRAAHRVGCGYSRRALPTVGLVKRMITEGFWGKLKECRFGVGGVGGYSVGEKYYSDPRIAGGGLLMEIGVHCIDAVLFCSGGSPVGNLAGRMVTEGDIDIHTQGSTSLRLDDGTCMPFNFEVTMLKETSGCIEFVFDHYTVSFSLFDNRGIEVRKTGGKSSYTITGDLPVLSGKQMLACFWMRYFEALRAGRSNETSAIDSLGVTQLVEAAYQLTTAPVVQIPPVMGEPTAILQ